jgi:hypothetical protein
VTSTVRPVLLALVAAVASWAAIFVLLGNNGLQYAVSEEFTRVFANPPAMIASALVAFGVAFAMARVTVMTRRDLPTLVATLIAANAVLTVLATVLAGELELPHARTIFLVLSAGGLQILAVAVAGWFAGRPRVTSP